MKSYEFLLIDDDPDEHLIFSMVISELPVLAHCQYYFRVQDAIDSLGMITPRSPDAILLTCGAPVTRAESSVVSLHQVIQPGATKLICYSAFDRTALMPWINQYGCYYLQKSVSVQEIASALALLLSEADQTAFTAEPGKNLLEGPSLDSGAIA
ncbi:MAG: hypothetical protein BGO21_20450 [Dyadobacter sp. 50-39]|nr:MAG: hypothetical protein BGO21_20450 [Dyadobacter sp. 50-39]